MIDLSAAVWRKSTRSGGNGGECVEVALNLRDLVVIRDSKNHTPAAWSRFTAALG